MARHKCNCQQPAIQPPMLSLPPTAMSVVDERKRLASHFQAKSATYCAACGQNVAPRKRTLNHGMAKALIRIYAYLRDHPSEVWCDVPALFHYSAAGVEQRGGDYAKLEYWGLIFRKPATRDDGSNRAGLWGITDAGRAFVEGRMTVPMHATVYNEQCLCVWGKLVTISEVLDEPFDFRSI